MKIALLGLGKEGQATEKYFTSKFNASCDIYEDLTPEQFRQRDYSFYDIIFRSPSVPPLNLPNETSVTKYFFEHCPCPIIGVTGTKGKGTTCSFIKSILDALGQDAHLVGNIGVPAINVLDELTPNSVVVYEMSSFQLWDLTKSPHIAVVLRIEPDHLDVHKDFADYVNAKSHIAKFQSPDDYIVYFKTDADSTKIAQKSPAHQVTYPFTLPDDIKKSIRLPGQHNIENATAAIAAVASYLNLPPEDFLAKYSSKIKQGLRHFKGLPHRLEFIRELDHIKYYDDNFSTNPASTRVAIDAFPDSNLVVIIGGRDKTNYADLPEIRDILQSPQIKIAILLGESGLELAKRYPDLRFRLVNSLPAAVTAAHLEAKAIEEGLFEEPEQNPRLFSRKKTTPAPEPPRPTVVLMSPAAASFDMFDNVYDRGDQFQKLVKALKN